MLCLQGGLARAVRPVPTPGLQSQPVVCTQGLYRGGLRWPVVTPFPQEDDDWDVPYFIPRARVSCHDHLSCREASDWGAGENPKVNQQRPGAESRCPPSGGGDRPGDTGSPDWPVRRTRGLCSCR